MEVSLAKEMQTDDIEQLLKQLNGETYTGPERKGKAHGEGKKVLEGGLVYEGGFHDGFFHGNGAITFSDGGKFVGIWNRGKMQQGQFHFQDGLCYQSTNWDYCSPQDRRFWDEVQQGQKFSEAPRIYPKKGAECPSCD
ncbi:hypothetical protein AAMO2058_001749600 [Amorphochlora amoebiformis]